MTPLHTDWVMATSFWTQMAPLPPWADGLAPTVPALQTLITQMDPDTRQVYHLTLIPRI